MKRTLGRLISIMMTVAMITSSAAMPAYAATEKDPDIAVESSVAESEVSESTEGEGVSSETDETEALGEETAETSEISSDDTEAADESDETGDSEEEMTEGTDESVTVDETSEIKEAGDEVEMVGDDNGFVISGTKLVRYTGSDLVVYLPANIEVIGENAFKDNKTLGYLCLENNKVLKTIEDKAFYGCTNLSKFDVHNSIQYIGDSAFEGCTILETAVCYSEGIKEIGDYAFKNTAITRVDLHKDLEKIGKGAFNGCKKLESVNYRCANNVTVGQQSVPGSAGFNIDDCCFSGCSIYSLGFSEDVTSIPDYLFCYAGFDSGGNGVWIKSSIESIGEYAFAYANVEKVYSNGEPEFRVIEKCAFRGCSKLVCMELPSATTEIGNYAFAESGLPSITLPESLETVGIGVFNGCEDLTAVTVNSTDLQSVGYEATGTGLGIDFVTSQSCFYGCNISSIEFGDNVTYIPAYMFCRAGITSNTVVEIPQGVKTIGKYAFAYTNIGNPIISGEALLYIREGAFKKCSQMTSIDLPSGVEDIEDYAFAKSGLQSITLPRDLETIGKGAFNSCNKLDAVTVNSVNIQSVGCTEEGNGTDFATDSCCFRGCNIIDLEFDEDVTHIPAYLFTYAGFKEGNEVKLPTKVTRIGKAAFAYSEIEKIECGGGLVEIGELAFSNCDQLTDIYLSSKIETIAENAFDGVVSSNFTVHAPSNSFAISWAQGKGFATEAVDTHKIIYHLDGGVNSAANPDVYMTGHGIGRFAEPTKTGYTFDGWFADSDKTVPKNGIASTENEDVDVYADWHVNKYTIEFDKNAGDASGTVAKKENLEYNVTCEFSAADVFSRPRYKQTAWNTKPDGTGNEYKLDATVKNLADNDGETVKLYAVWSSLDKYTLVYDLNAETAGGKVTGSIKKQTYQYNKTVKISSTQPKAAGYKFLGWAFSSSATKADFAPGTECTEGSGEMSKLIKNAEGNDNTATLYAVWKPAEYNIIVYAEPKKLLGEDTEYKPFNNVKYGEAVDISGLFTKADHTLVSYKNDKNKTVVSGEVKDLTTGDGATVKLYAQWKETAYGITYVDSKKDVGAVMKNGNKAKSFTVGTKSITLKAPTKEGYRFDGWIVSGMAGDPVITGEKITAIEKGKYHQPIVLTATWAAQDVTYKIMVQDEGVLSDKTTALADEMVNKNPVTFANTKNITLKKPSITGYTFIGWYDDDKCTQKNGKISKNETDSSDPIIKYALFAENTYKLVINANNKNKDKAVYEDVKFSDTVKLKESALDKGWTYDEGSPAQIKFFSAKGNGKGANYDPQAEIKGLSSKNKSTVNLYAIWDTYRITYTDAEADESSSVMKNNSSNPVIFTAGTEGQYLALKDPTKTGYKFNGWSSVKGDALLEDASGKWKINRGMNGPQDLTVSASWTANTYEIYLYPNAKDVKLKTKEGTTAVSNSKSAGKCACVTATYDGKEFKYDGSALATLNGIKYVRPGYIFKEWNTKANGKGKAYDPEEALNLTSKNGASTILYAVWVKVAPLRVTGVHIGNQKILYFDEQDGVDKYEYQMSENITSVYGQKKNTVTGSGIKRFQPKDKGKKYIRVRAYKTDSAGNKVYGPWSFIKCVTIDATHL